MIRNLHIIINPSSQEPVPILSHLNKILQSTDIDWQISVTRKAGDARDMTQQAVEKGADGVAVYGGDGTVMEVAQSLVHTDVPLLILPAGTANILAKELEIPMFIEQSVQLLTGENTRIRTIDIGKVNDTYFMLRLSIGSLADMILSAQPELKSNFGQLAYGISAIERLREAVPATYTITIDEKEITKEGMTMMIANSGNIAFSGIPFASEIKIDDGLLDIILIKKTDLGYLASVVGEALINRRISPELDHWKVSKAHITVHPTQSVICDDYQLETLSLGVEVIPQALKVVTRDI